METTLIISQILFNFSISTAVIILGISCWLITYHLISIARELKKLSHNLNYAASDAGERIQEIIDKLSDVPVLSYFLKRPLSNDRRKIKKRHSSLLIISKK